MTPTYLGVVNHDIQACDSVVAALDGPAAQQAGAHQRRRRGYR